MLIVGLGGVAGTVLRVMVSGVVGGFALWLINVAGSMALGYLNGRLPGKSNWKLFIGTGMLGSFTTFSAFSNEWFSLLERDLFLGLLYGFCMTALCFIGCLGGYHLGKVRGPRS